MYLSYKTNGVKAQYLPLTCGGEECCRNENGNTPNLGLLRAVPE